MTEYCEGGSLHALLHSNMEVTDDMKLKWMTDVAAGMVKKDFPFFFLN